MKNVFGLTLLCVFAVTGCDSGEADSSAEGTAPSGGEQLIGLLGELDAGGDPQEQVVFEGDAIEEGFQFAADVSSGVDFSEFQEEEAGLIKESMCDGVIESSCEDCLCSDCTALANACNQEIGCLAYMSCTQKVGCIAAQCFTACADVIAQYGGMVSKGVDLAVKLSSCALTNCLDICLEELAGGGGGGDDGPGNDEGGNDEGGNNTP